MKPAHAQLNLSPKAHMFADPLSAAALRDEGKANTRDPQTALRAKAPRPLATEAGHDRCVLRRDVLDELDGNNVLHNRSVVAASRNHEMREDSLTICWWALSSQALHD